MVHRNMRRAAPPVEDAALKCLSRIAAAKRPPRRRQSSTLMLWASRPFWPSTTPSVTCWPSASDSRPGPRQSGAVDEHVLAAVVHRDEAEALGGIVPLHGAAHLDRRSAGGTATAAATAVAATAAVTTATAAVATTAAAVTTAATAGAEAAGPRTELTPGRRRLGRGRVDAGDARHLRALLTLGRGHRQPGTRHEIVVAGSLDGADVEEGIARAVTELDEAEALLLVEPLDRGITLWPGSDRSCATRRAAVETTPAEAAAAATTETTATEPAAGGSLIRPSRLATLVEAALLRPPKITTTSHRKLAKTVRRPCLEYRVRAIPDSPRPALSLPQVAVTKNNAPVLTQSGLDRKDLLVSNAPVPLLSCGKQRSGRRASATVFLHWSEGVSETQTLPG